MSTAELKAAELESLKARADLRGVKYHPSIGADALREKIKAAEAGETPKDEPETAEAVETKNQKLRRIVDEANKLIRIRLQCLNPAKREWPGEIFATGNAATGTIKKFVPFNADEGYHVPNMIYQMLKDRQCQVFYNDKVKNGVTVRKGKLIKEFAIEVLPPLTPEELHDLAQRQAMANGTAE